MPQPAKANWADRPSTKKRPVASAAADQFVSGKRGDLVRLNADVPRELRVRLKSYCAAREIEMGAAIIEALEKLLPK